VDEDQLWRLTGMASGALAAMATRRLLVGFWKTYRGTEPPSNPAAKGTTWPEALAWAAVSGAALGVAKMLMERGAAEAWKVASGAYPADLEQVRP
jgi:hypothetical protein